MALPDVHGHLLRHTTQAASAGQAIPLSSFYDLAVRSMAERVTRTLLTALGIVIGVAVILAVDVTNATTLVSIRNLFDETSGRASLIVEPAALGTEGFDEAMLRDVLRGDGVVTAAPAVQVQASLVGETVVRNSAFAAGPQGGITLLGVNPGVDAGVRIYSLTEGRLLNIDDEYAAVIGQELSDEHQLGLGDDVLVVTPFGELGLEVVGVIAPVGVGRTNDGFVVIAPLHIVQEAFDRRTQVTQIDVVVDPAIADDADRLDALKDELDDSLSRHVDVSYPAARSQLVGQMLATYQVGLNFFAVIAIFVGGFLIYNAFSMTILERTREIGVLRSLGATRRQIVLLILAEGLVLAICATMIGVIAGILLASALIQLMGTMLSTSLDVLSIPAESLVKSFIVGVVVTLLSALLPAYQGGRTSPLEVMRIQAHTDRPPALGRWHWLPGVALFSICYLILQLESVPEGIVLTLDIVAVLGVLLGASLLVSPVVDLWEPLLRRGLIRLYGPEGRLGSSNIQRARSRTALTVSALMIGVTMVIALGEQTNSFRADLLDWVETAIGGDLYVRSITPMRPEFERQLLNIPGIQAATATSFTVARLVETGDDQDSKRVSIKAIDPTTYLQVASFKFDDPAEDAVARVAELAQGDAVFVATTVADRHGIRQGEEIVLETNRGIHAFRVSGIIVDFSAQGNTIIMSRRDLDRYFGLRRVHMFTLDVAPGFDAATVADEIESRYGDRENIAVESSAEFQERVIGLMNQSFAMLNALVGIALIVSSLGVINTLMMNILERTREIGMLRSLGMTRRQIAKMVLAESATMGVMGSLFGLIVGLLLAEIFIKGTNLAGGYRLTYIFSPLPVVLGLGVALLLSQVAAFYPAHQATRINIVAAIKHE